MTAIFTATAHDALTANGTSLGVVTIASTAKYMAGATVWIRSSTQAELECIVAEVLSSTTLALRRKDAANKSGRSPMNVYLTADGASLDMESQVVPVFDQYVAYPKA